MNTIQTKDKTRWLAHSKLSRMAVAAALAFSVFQGFAQQVPSQPVKNIVLVHGAFADGSSWSKVTRILQAKGYNVTAVQNPLTSFADDVAATRRALALQNGPVILVGHSWAGVVITEAGMETNVVGLVYVAAFGPDVGETAEALGKSYPPPASFANAIVDTQGFMTLSTDAFVQHFAWDLPVADSKVLAATQGPINTSAFSATVSNVAWKTKPSWFIVAEKDQAISPDEERFFARRLNATTTELNTSHVPMLSKPKQVAAAIMDAAAKGTTKSSPKGAFTATQNLTAIRRGIEETTHRFEDAFNRSDAAGAAVLHAGCPRPAARGRDGTGPGQDRRVLGNGRGRASDGRPAGGAIHAPSAGARRRSIRDRTRHAHPRGRPAPDAAGRPGMEG